MPSLALALRLLVANVLIDALFSWLTPRRSASAPPRPGCFALLAGGALRAVALYVAAGHWNAVWILPVAWGAHAAIEAFFRRDHETLWRFLSRQGAYLILVIGVWMGLTGVGIAEIGRGVRRVAAARSFWIVLTAYGVVLWPAGQLVALFTEPWRKRIEDAARQGLANAGLWIGRIERVLILTSVLVGRYELIGFLVAAKSILRFADIRAAESRQEAEYILVGTMLSYALAIGVGVVARLLLR